MRTSDMRILLVHNPGAGDTIHTRGWFETLARGHGHQLHYYKAKEGWQAALDELPIDLVVAAGGDGTVADVARQLAGTGTPLAVLPFGTANNVATSLGIADTAAAELVERWPRAARRPFDTGLAIAASESFRFVESVGLGLLADCMAEIAEGEAGYVDELDQAEERLDAAMDVLTRTLRGMDPVPAELDIDGRKLAGEYLLVEVMNIGSAGPNLRLAPGADSGDGLLDVVVAEERHRAQLLADLPLYREGKAGLLPLPVCRGRRVRLACEPCRLHLDDELRADRAGFDATVDPQSLVFLV